MLPKQKQNIIEGINDQITAELFNPSRELSACEDIANGSKHLIPTRRSRMTSQRAGYAEIVQSAEVNVGTRSVEERFEIDIDGQNRDLREVADKAVAAWG